MELNPVFKDIHGIRGVVRSHHPGKCMCLQLFEGELHHVRHYDACFCFVFVWIKGDLIVCQIDKGPWSTPSKQQNLAALAM